MALFVYCLIIMTGLTLISVMTGQDLVSVAIQQSYTASQSINGTTSDWSVDLLTDALDLDPVLEAVIWITVIGLIAVGAGVTVIGSGLNDKATHWLAHFIFFTALWVLLSGLSQSLIQSIEMVGSLIYLTLTIIYAISCIMYIGKSS